jgi:FdhD protein
MPSDPIQPDARSITLSVRRLGLAQAGDAGLTRAVPIEAPIAIEVGGFGYAVMMATPPTSKTMPSVSRWPRA